jgi:hypothetical protein
MLIDPIENLNVHYCHIMKIWGYMSLLINDENNNA